MFSVKLKQTTFLVFFSLLSLHTAFAQQFTEKASSLNLDLDGKKDGGFSFGDLNNDGFLDLIVNTEEDDLTHRTRIYFFNTLTNSFEDVTSEKCPSCAQEQIGSSFTERSLVIADFNNDGFKDFVRNNSKRLDVFLNNGSDNGFTFGSGSELAPNFFLFTNELTDDNPPNGIPNGMNTEGIGVLDYDNDGWLDLFIENHNWGMEIYRNTGDASNLFEYVSPDITGLPAGVGAEVKDNFGDRVSGDYAAVTDFNDDGFIDVIARKSSGIEYDLMQRDPNGPGFTNGQDLQDAYNLNKGGVAFHDFDNDGDFDLIWTEAKQTLLYEQTENGFVDITPEISGIDVSQATKIDGVAAGDVDNDGDIDIFLTDSLGSSFLFINQLNSRELGPNSGTPLTFVQNNLGIDLQADGEGCLFVDFDSDGDLDLFINVKEGKNQYWENNLADNGSDDFLKVNVFENRIDQNRYALGATLTLKDICGNIISGIREVNGGSGHGTQDPSEVMLSLPELTQQSFILNVKFPVYNGSRKEIDLLIESGVQSIDVFPTMNSTVLEEISLNLNDDVFDLASTSEFSVNVLSNDTILNCPTSSIRLIEASSEFGAAELLEDGTFSFVLTDTTQDFETSFTYEVQCDVCDSKIDTASIVINYLSEDDSGGSDCPDIVLINPIFKTKACLSPLESVVSVPTCDSLAITILENTQNGTFTLLDNQGNFSYIVNNDFVGTDSLTYSVVCVTDNCEKTVETTLYIEVLPEKASLQLTDDFIDATSTNICSGENVQFNLTSNDVFENCVSTTFSILENPTQGDVSINNEGIISYTLSNSGFKGIDTFTYIAVCESCDNIADTASVQIDIDCISTPPTECDTLVVSNQFFNTKECLSPLSANLDLSTIACESIQLSVTIPAQHGEFQFNDENGEFVYTLTDTDFIGTDSVTYSLSCSGGDYCENTTTSKVFINVLPEEVTLVLVDDLPADIGVFNTCADSIFTFDATKNDIIENCVSLDFNIINEPSNGIASIDSEGIISYSVKEAGFLGFDTLAYEVTCESCENVTDTAIAVIEVIQETGELLLTSDFPSDSTGRLNSCITDSITLDVTANDIIENCLSTTFKIIDQPLNGGASVDNNGQLTYSLGNPEFTGFDTLSYSVTCESCITLTDTALVVIEIVSENGTLVLLDDLPSDIGAFNTCKSDNFSFSVATNDTIENCINPVFEIITQTNNGTAIIDGEGIVSYSLTNSEFIGFDTLSYSVTCESCETLTDTALVVIEIVSENGTLVLLDDLPSDIGTFNTCKSDDFSFSLAANDTIENCINPVFAIITQTNNGAAIIDGEGIVSYSLTNSEFIGFDTLSYSVTCESCETLTDTALAVIEVINTNLPIELSDITLSTTCETDEVLFVSLGLESLLSNCDSSSVSIIKGANEGEALIDENGNFTYNLLSDTFNGADTITYEVYCQSCEEQTTTASVFVDVSCELCEDISVANQTFGIESCSNEIVDQLDVILDCNTISYTVLNPPSQGSFAFNGNDGSFTYTLSNLEFTSTDSVVYEITCLKDCGEKSTTATIYFDLTNNTLEIPVITKLVTPNGDNFNEFLRINNIECYPTHVFKVFNRWGNLIFETDDYENTPEKGWSGQVNKNTGIAPGSFVGDGTYFCVLEFGNGNDVSEYVEIRGSNR